VGVNRKGYATSGAAQTTDVQDFRYVGDGLLNLNDASALGSFVCFALNGQRPDAGQYGLHNIITPNTITNMNQGQGRASDLCSLLDTYEGGFVISEEQPRRSLLFTKRTAAQSALIRC
jgi:hypothetical protein